ncbi:MAG: hypothetical protein WAN43_06195 [Rhodomicrobium sp.]|jgi:hypothetical protein
MTAEPDSPDEPRLEPAGGGSGVPKDKPTRPRGPLLEGRALPQPSGGLLLPVAAGLIGGLVGAGLVYFLTAGPSTDTEARQVINQLNTKLAELGEAAKAAASTEQLSEVRKKIDAVAGDAKTAGEAAQSAAEKIQALEQKTSAEPAKETIHAEVASQIAPVATQITSVTAQVAPLADRVAGLERVQGERSSDARTAALTISLTNLKRAVAEGRPFDTELTAVENLTSSKLPISDIAAYKDKGVASLAELQREFAQVARNVIQRHYHGKADSVVGEVLSRARAAIQVKPSGGAGDTIEAVVGRIDSALKTGNLRAALTEAASVDGPAKEELQAWLDRAQARASADEAVQKTESELLASLSKSSARSQ